MIPEVAVEAAADAINEFNAHAISGRFVPLKDLSGLDREHALGEARAALEAAAPHMGPRNEDDPKARMELRRMVYQVETQDFGGYSTRDAHAVADALFDAGYRMASRG